MSSSVNSHDEPPPPYDSPEVWSSQRPSSLPVKSTPIHSRQLHETGRLVESDHDTGVSSSSSTQSVLQEQLPVKHQSLRSVDSKAHRFKIRRFPDGEDCILDLNIGNATIAYTTSANRGSLFSSKPHMTIDRGSYVDVFLSRILPTSPQPSLPVLMGTANFHVRSTNIDLNINGKEIIMCSPDKDTYDHEYGSAAFGRMLQWKTLLEGGDLVLKRKGGEDEEWIARFERRIIHSLMGDGEFEIRNCDSREKLDEVVGAGLAMCHKMRAA